MRRSVPGVGAARSIAVGLCGATLLAGCGRVAAEDKPRGAREAGTVVLSAVIEDAQVLLSPSRVGAGPVRVVVTNQSRSRVRPVLRRGSRRAAAASLPPGGVVALTTRVSRGRWVLRAGAERAPAGLLVGRERPSADSELLQV